MNLALYSRAATRHRLPAWAVAAALAAGAAGAAADSRIEVVFDDPGLAYSAYYADIERVTVAAGDAWIDSFQSLAAGALLTVRVNFSDIATASGASLSSAWLGTGADGLHLYQQGAAHELLTGIDSNGATADIGFNLGMNGYLQGELWFDPAPALRLAAVPDNRTDAMSVLLHEFGHALGFNGWRDASTGALPGNYQSTFDALVGTGAGGTGLVFAGAQAAGLYGAALPLTAGNYGHLGNAGFGADLIPDLMNGVVFFRGTRYAISPLDLMVMNDLGLQTVAVVPEPGTAALWLAGLAACAVLSRRRLGRAERGDSSSAGGPGAAA